MNVPTGLPASTTPPVDVDRAPVRRTNYIPPSPRDLQSFLDRLGPKQPPQPLKGRSNHQHIHDYGTDGRCRIEGCRVFDPTECEEIGYDL